MHLNPRHILSVAVAAWVATTTSIAFAAEYATVISSVPVAAQVPVTRQVCTQALQYVQQAPSGIGALIGAIAGGVIGNSIGGGFGRAAATGLGVVAGSVAGDQAEAAGNPVIGVPARRCELVSRYENRTVGYDVVYEYAGQRYSTRLQRDPGPRFAVDVQPARGAIDGASVDGRAVGSTFVEATSVAADPVDTPVRTQPVPVYRNTVSEPPAPYVEPSAVYYDPLLPRPIYYEPAPRAVYYGPTIGFGLGYYGGYRGRHWH